MKQLSRTQVSNSYTEECTNRALEGLRRSGISVATCPVSMKKFLFALFTGFLLLTGAFAQIAHAGGTEGGGATIGNELAEDALPKIDMKGTKPIPVVELEKLAEPILRDLDKKIPGLAATLREGFTNIKWYTDKKTFNPAACQDQSMFQVHEVIRACQDDASIRIQESYFDAHPQSKLLPDLIVHELVVHWAGQFPVNKKVMAVSAAVRNRNLSADALQKILGDNGFGVYLTAAGIQWNRSEIQKAICPLAPGSADTYYPIQMAVDPLFRIQGAWAGMRGDSPIASSFDELQLSGWHLPLTNLTSLAENNGQIQQYFKDGKPQDPLFIEFTNDVVNFGAIAAQGQNQLDYPVLGLAITPRRELVSLQQKYGCSARAAADPRASDATTVKTPSADDAQGSPAGGDAGSKAAN